MPPAVRRTLVERANPELPLSTQARLLSVSRSSLYYQPAAEAEENLRLMQLIDQEYTAHPFLGSRRLTKWLIEHGEAVNGKRVRRVMTELGLRGRAPARRVRTTDSTHAFPR